MLSGTFGRLEQGAVVRMVILKQMVAVIFLLFILCFIAIIIEECFLGGRRKRALQREARLRLQQERVNAEGARAGISDDGAVS